MSDNNPRLILICCEGLTEELYFNMVVDIRRIPNTLVPPAKSFNGAKHKRLIDICEQVRADASTQYDLKEAEIEVWSVFDKDDWSNGFTELEHYANSKKVRLAYSDPQFETYLLQHLSQDRSRKFGTNLENHLSQKMNSAGHGATYNKSDLTWLRNLIDKTPSTIEMAITNSCVRNNRTKTPFLTTHRLIKRLLEFEPK